MNGKKISFVLSGDFISAVVVDGGKLKPVTFHIHPSIRKKVFDAIKKDNVKEFMRHADLSNTVNTYMDIGKVRYRNSSRNHDVKIVGGKLFFNGKEQHDLLAKKTVEMMDANLPFVPLVRFMVNLEDNQYRESKQELFLFLEKHGMPVTEDGCFLAYKRIRNDWTDFRTGKIKNKIGTWVKKNPKECDPNRRLDCSEGLHVGTISYINNFHVGDGKIIIVKVNPAHVVSVPASECDKMRVYRYKVLSEMSELLVEGLYKHNGQKI